jgi:hypothetical protein
VALHSDLVSQPEPVLVLPSTSSSVSTPFRCGCASPTPCAGACKCVPGRGTHRCHPRQPQRHHRQRGGGRQLGRRVPAPVPGRRARRRVGLRQPAGPGGRRRRPAAVQPARGPGARELHGGAGRAAGVGSRGLGHRVQRPVAGRSHIAGHGVLGAGRRARGPGLARLHRSGRAASVGSQRRRSDVAGRHLRAVRGQRRRGRWVLGRPALRRRRAGTLPHGPGGGVCAARGFGLHSVGVHSAGVQLLRVPAERHGGRHGDPRGHRGRRPAAGGAAASGAAVSGTVAGPRRARGSAGGCSAADPARRRDRGPATTGAAAVRPAGGGGLRLCRRRGRGGVRGRRGCRARPCGPRPAGHR